MSRLDSVIRRLESQRACLDLAARLIADVPGPVLELGLGNGRTYNHLREILPGREIFVFDRRVAAHPDCIPDPEHMMVGEFADTLPAAVDRLGASAALAHADCGSPDPAENAARTALVASYLTRLVRPQGIIVSDQALEWGAWTPLPLPPAVAPGRYFMYRVHGHGGEGR